MKFSLFVHMERMDRSVSYRQAFDDLTELVQLAERGGFDTAWIGEHHGMEFTIAPNPFLNIAYLAARTQTIRLGTSTVVAPFWHPIRLAGEAAMADIATGGRLDVSIARGAYSFEFERLGEPGLDAWRAGQYLRELVPALPRLWAGDYTHDGEIWQFPSTTCVPHPMQDPHPPLWIAARDPNSHEFAVANGCNVQVTPLWQDDGEVHSLMERFEAACSACPQVPRPKVMLLRHTYVAADEADAQLGSEQLSRYYQLFMTWFQNKNSITKGFIEPPTAEQAAGMAMVAAPALRENLVVGPPDEVIARLKHYESLGYDQYALWVDSGMSAARKRASVTRFIDKVMPAFN